MEQESSAPPLRAGGRATEAGITFQAAVATWFAVHILVRLPVGGRFDINNQALPVAIRLEDLLLTEIKPARDQVPLVRSGSMGGIRSCSAAPQHLEPAGGARTARSGHVDRVESGHRCETRIP